MMPGFKKKEKRQLLPVLAVGIPKAIMNHILQAPGKWILLLSAEQAQPKVQLLPVWVWAWCKVNGFQSD